MSHPQNPYIAGNPINDQDRFIGRTDVMRETLRILRNPNTNALVLHGQRRIGKTSILLRLQKDLDSDYSPIYFDLQDKAAAPLGDVLYQLAQAIASANKITLPERSHFDNSGDFFRQQFLPKVAEQVAPHTLVLLFDEFDVLDLPQEGQAGSAFFPYLRTWMAQTQAVKFVFVLGRRPEELSTDTLATFKGTQSVRVSLMNQTETLEIIRLAEKNQSLYWHKDAVEQIWHWTQGHPYFTQLLCSEIWESAYDDSPTGPPTIDADAVEAAIQDALEQGANAFQWIWKGLPHAERIVMAAMAEERAATISQQQLTEMLSRSGVRLILRELDLAPEMLEKWDLLRRVQGENPTESTTYRFAIPLLKRWVQENAPLRRVKAELDSIEPQAMRFYQSATDLYNLGDLDDAERLLTRALNVNPNHMQSRLLLGRVQLSKGYPTAAVETLEPAYAFDPRMARQDYVAALLAVAEAKTDTDQRLATYRVILKIEPDQPVAKERWTTGWQQKAEAALTAANYEAAVNAYQQLGDQASINHVLTLQSKAQLAHLVTTAGNHEKAERWVEAVEIYTELLAKFPADESWPKRLATAKEEADLTTLYAQSLGLIQEKKLKSASKLLAQVIGRRPGYKESARYLLLALHGDDVTTLKEKLATATSQSANLQTQLATITQQAKMQQAQIANLEKELAQLRPPPTQATAAQAVSAPTQNLNDPAIERKLALWNPLNHLRLLWWIWQPKALKQFHASLNNGQRERHCFS